MANGSDLLMQTPSNLKESLKQKSNFVAKSHVTPSKINSNNNRGVENNGKILTQKVSMSQATEILHA